MLIYARPWCGDKCGTQGLLPPKGRDYSALLPTKNTKNLTDVWPVIWESPFAAKTGFPVDFN